ncbi:MAG: GldG family protein [Bdellovibrionales bacterium]
MNKTAKISFISAFLIAVAVFTTSLLLQQWWNLFTVLLIVAGLAVAAGLALDYRTIVDFFTRRTTKHGMNMGVAIIVVLILVICVNYLANLHNKSWDLTQEKLNSLSDESTSVLNNLSGDLEVKIFTRDNAQSEDKQRLKQAMLLYGDYSGKVKVHYINPYVDTALAMEYLNGLTDRDTQSTFVFVEYGGKKVRAESPFDEAAITSAMIKATRQGESKIYFVKGHGEKDIETDGAEGIKDLARSLGESSFKVAPLNLLDQKEIPKDATAVAIIGPRVAFLEAELKQLREYAEGGGKLFIAMDPGERTNVAALAKSLGIEFENNYVFTLTPLAGGGPALIMGRVFDPASEITRNFAANTNFALFYLVSEVKAASDRNPAIQVRELVKSDAMGFTVNDVSQKLTKKPDTKQISIAAESKGKFSEASPKEFAAVVFGDSDFLSNRSLMDGVNRDLVLNSFAKLAEQKDLLSVRPKMPKGTMMILTGIERVFVILLGLLLPMLLFIASGVLWFRRRGA